MNSFEISLTEAGSGNEVSVSLKDITQTLASSISPEDYGFHKIAGGVRRPGSPEQWFDCPMNADGTMLLRGRGLPPVIVLHPMEEIKEAMAMGVTSLYMSPDVQKRRLEALQAAALESETIHVSEFGPSAAKTNGRRFTVERSVSEIMTDLGSGKTAGNEPTLQRLKDLRLNSHAKLDEATL